MIHSDTFTVIKIRVFPAPRYLPDRVTDLQMTESDYNGMVSLTWTASGNELDAGTGKHLTMFIVIYPSQT